MKKYDYIKDLSIAELQQQINDAERELQRLKFAHGLSPIENPLQIRTLRRQVARLLTALTSKQKQSEAQK
jgi:large subunit ribosomal protein L29